MLWRSYSRDACTGELLEGSGCHYCDVTKSKSDEFEDLTPKQCQILINKQDEEGKGKRTIFARIQLEVINILVAANTIAMSDVTIQVL